MIDRILDFYRTTANRGTAAIHLALLLYSALSIGPIVLIVINAFKAKKDIFAEPLALPDRDSFTLAGFEKVFGAGDFMTYFANSLVVTLVSILVVTVTGSMAAWALSQYRFLLREPIRLFFALGIMVPVRLGTVSILRIMVDLELMNTLTALIVVYAAQNIPIAVFILTVFMAQIPKELHEAARCDGVNEFRIFLQVGLPLARPAIATVAVFTMVPIWNDLWFPLILAPGDAKQTVTLGVQQFIGQYVTDWGAVIASLSLAMLPILLLYFFFSRQLIRGLTAGAVK